MTPNTGVEMILNDSSKTVLTAAFGYMYKLKARNKEVMADYDRIMAKGSSITELDMTRVLYAAYLCGSIKEDVKDPMSYEDFLDQLSPNRNYIRSIFQELYQGKAPTASGSRS